MRRCWSVASIALLAGSALAITPEYVPGQILLRTKPGFSPILAVRALGGTELRSYTGIDGLSLVKLPVGMSVPTAIKYLTANSSVKYAEPNYIVRGHYVPNDPMLGRQYSPSTMNVFKAWDFTKGDPNVTVAVIDSGVDYTHVDLAGKVTLGHDYANNDDDPMDDFGHGTHVSGIIAGGLNNGIGIAGIGGNVRILAIKFLGSDNSGSIANSILAVKEAVDKGASVLNMSYGSYFGSQAEFDGINYALGKNAVLISSSGNNNFDSTVLPSYPASYPGVISVGATDSNDLKADFSNYGPSVSVAAPGVSVLSTVPNNGYEEWSGTSMAAPNVAGVAALMISRVGKTTLNTKIKQILEKSTKFVGSWLQNGRVDAYLAVRDAAPPIVTNTRVTSLKAVQGYNSAGLTADAAISGDGRAFAVIAKPVVGSGMLAESVATWSGLKATPASLTSANLTIRSAAIAGAAGMYWVWNNSLNNNIGGWQFVNSFLVGTGYLTATLPLGGANTDYSKLISSTGEVKVRFRTVLPTRFGAVSYRFRTDYLNLTTSEAVLK